MAFPGGGPSVAAAYDAHEVEKRRLSAWKEISDRMPGRTATQIKSLWYGKLRVTREQCLGLVGRYLRHLSAFPKGEGDPRARAEAYALTLKQLSGGASTATADGTAAAQFTRSCKGEGGGEDLRGAAEGGAGVGGCGEASLGYYVGSQDPAGAAVDWARRGSTSARAALMSGAGSLGPATAAASAMAAGGNGLGGAVAAFTPPPPPQTRWCSSLPPAATQPVPAPHGGLGRQGPQPAAIHILGRPWNAEAAQAAAVGAGGGCTALPAAGEATALDPAHGYHGYDDGAAGTFPAGARDSGGPAAARTAGGAAEPGGASGGWRSSVGGLEYLGYPVATAAAQRLGLLGGGGDCGGAGDDGDSRWNGDRGGGMLGRSASCSLACRCGCRPAGNAEQGYGGGGGGRGGGRGALTQQGRGGGPSLNHGSSRHHRDNDWAAAPVSVAMEPPPQALAAAGWHGAAPSTAPPLHPHPDAVGRPSTAPPPQHAAWHAAGPAAAAQLAPAADDFRRSAFQAPAFGHAGGGWHPHGWSQPGPQQPISHPPAMAPRHDESHAPGAAPGGHQGYPGYSGQSGYPEWDWAAPVQDAAETDATAWGYRPLNAGQHDPPPLCWSHHPLPAGAARVWVPASGGHASPHGVAWGGPEADAYASNHAPIEAGRMQGGHAASWAAASHASVEAAPAGGSLTAHHHPSAPHNHRPRPCALMESCFPSLELEGVAFVPGACERLQLEEGRSEGVAGWDDCVLQHMVGKHVPPPPGGRLPMGLRTLNGKAASLAGQRA